MMRIAKIWEFLCGHKQVFVVLALILLIIWFALTGVTLRAGDDNININSSVRDSTGVNVSFFSAGEFEHRLGANHPNFNVHFKEQI